ncbi:hypothetical protein LPJ70_001890, partial [Coemansia sp. RSA 2708]
PMQTFLVVVHDFTDDEALGRRLSTRPTHLAEATRRRAGGQLVSGGAILDADGKMIGSALVVNAESRDRVMELLRTDPYSTQRAWDLSTAQIYAYREAEF